MITPPLGAPPPTPWPRWVWVGLLLGVGLAVGGAVLLVIPSPRVVDEHVYHLMVKSLSEGSPWAILNGYEVFPSSELQVGRPGSWLHVREVGGQLVAQYPPLYALLCWPFYVLGGMSGIFWLNILGFAGAMVWCSRLTWHLGSDGVGTLLAPVLLGLATPAWRLSVSMLPHGVALFFMAGSLYLAITSVLPGLPHPHLRRMGAGLMLGLGCHMRLDSIVMAPALLFPLVFSAEGRLRRCLEVVGGLMVPLLLLSWFQYVRFGLINPFTYGGEELKQVVVTPERSVLDHMSSLYRLWIDPRQPGEVPPLSWLRRTGEGALLFQGLLQLSLLQTCPFLLGLWATPRRGTPLNLSILGALLLPVLGMGAVMVVMGINGIRYQMPIFPGVAMLLALCLRPLLDLIGLRWMALGGAVVLGLFTFHRSLPWHFPGDDVLSHQLPLVVAAICGVGGLWRVWGKPWLRGVWTAALGGAVMWGCLLNFSYQLPRERQERQERLAVTVHLSPAIPEHALILTTWPDPTFGLVEGRHLVIADPRHDNWEALPLLIATFHQRGRPVFSLFEPAVWEEQRLQAQRMGWSTTLLDIKRGWVLARWTPR